MNRRVAGEEIRYAYQLHRSWCLDVITRSISPILGVLVHLVARLLKLFNRHWLRSGHAMHNRCFLVSLMNRYLGVSDRGFDNFCSDRQCSFGHPCQHDC